MSVYMKRKSSSIEEVIKDVIGKMRSSGPSEEEVVVLWKEIVGEGAGRHSKPASLKKTFLTVNVDDSGWLYELSTRKKEIIKKMEGRLGGKKVKDIRFRIGEIKNSNR
jgi:predicted nucleic acid-binding Zn ribbon protein